MKEFEFTLKFALADSGIDANIYVDQLGEAGCTDALLGIGQLGRIALDFSRDAENAMEAVKSALEDVMNAIPDARLIEASPDLVGISDIASLIGVSRQNIRKLIINNIKTFPSPIHDGKSSIWHLSAVLNWFIDCKQKDIEPMLVEISIANMQLNIAKEYSYANPHIQAELTSVIIQN